MLHDTLRSVEIYVFAEITEVHVGSTTVVLQLNEDVNHH